MITLKIVRKPESHSYHRFVNKPDAWDNNDANNSLDDFFLYDKDKLLFKAKCQTVANIPGGHYLDTIAPGKFQVRLFVDQRNFWPMVHGIMNTYDLEGQSINERSIEPIPGKNGAPIDFSRWLIHDWQKHRDQKDENGNPIPHDSDTRVAWSAGCFVLRDSDLKCFSCILTENNYHPEDILNGELIQA